VEEGGHVVEWDLFTDASSQDAPSSLVIMVKLVHLKCHHRLGHRLAFATAFHPENDGVVGNGIVDRLGHGAGVVAIYESTYTLLPEQLQAFGAGQFLEFSLAHVLSLSAPVGRR
jgi:hypothetical protein